MTGFHHNWQAQITSRMLALEARDARLAAVRKRIQDVKQKTGTGDRTLVTLEASKQSMLDAIAESCERHSKAKRSIDSYLIFNLQAWCSSLPSPKFLLEWCHQTLRSIGGWSVTHLGGSNQDSLVSVLSARHTKDIDSGNACYLFESF